MAKEKIEFKDFKKECGSRTYQDNKCANEKNKKYRMVDSCQEDLCPIFKAPTTQKEEDPKPKEEKKTEK